MANRSYVSAVSGNKLSPKSDRAVTGGLATGFAGGLERPKTSHFQHIQSKVGIYIKNNMTWPKKQVSVPTLEELPVVRKRRSKQFTDVVSPVGEYIRRSTKKAVRRVASEPGNSSPASVIVSEVVVPRPQRCTNAEVQSEIKCVDSATQIENPKIDAASQTDPVKPPKLAFWQGPQISYNEMGSVRLACVLRLKLQNRIVDVDFGLLIFGFFLLVALIYKLF